VLKSKWIDSELQAWVDRFIREVCLLFGLFSLKAYKFSMQ